MEWYIILLIVLASVALFVFLSAILYRPFFKRFYDFILSLTAIVVLSPLLLILIVIGAIVMKGNPFFTQSRPGKNEKIFKLVKFRSMNNKRDENGKLLSDDQRLGGYGKFLRATSLDELPELFNIFAGHMSIVGPRPLLVKYIPLYSDEQHKRHKVRPGLTGLAQVHGRNLLEWKDKFDYDVKYVNEYGLFYDVGILFKTVFKVFKREGISGEAVATAEEFKGNE